jgi:hypothetical protein
MRVFLFVAVVAWGIGLGAKLYDLVVLAGAWSAAPPASLARLPYGPNYPVNPGMFFQPLSLLMLVPTLGAVIAGWRTAWSFRLWLWVPIIMFAIIWALTPTVFWPMNHDLYYGAIGKISKTDAELVQLARRWVALDWLRVAMIAIGLISLIRAISIPTTKKV